jgi:hypothetical protein
MTTPKLKFTENHMNPKTQTEISQTESDPVVLFLESISESLKKICRLLEENTIEQK